MKQEVRNTFERILKGDEAGACRLYEMARQGDGEAIYAFVCAMYSADLDRRILNKPLQQRADFIHETTFEQSVRAVNEYFSLLRQYMNPYKAMSKLRTGMAEETLIGTLLLFGYGVEKDEYNGLRFFVRSCEGLVDTVYTNNVKILYNTPQYRNKISLFIERLSWGNKEWIGYDGRFTRNSEYNYDTTEFRFAIYQCDLPALISKNGYIDIADTVKYIDDGAFENCSELKPSIIIPKYVSYIGKNAFKGCSGLKSIKIERDAIPSNWDANFNPDNIPVELGYKRYKLGTLNNLLNLLNNKEL